MPLLTAQSLLACLYFSGTALASIEFTIATGPCDNGAGLFNKCDDSAAGGMCASAPDITKKWCCPPATALCGSWGETCTGSSNTAGTGQIFCQSDDGSQKWCCNAKYDICVADAGVFNLCRTKFENPYANTTEEDALRLKSAYLSSSTSTRPAASSTTSTSTASTTPSTTSSTTLSTTDGASPATQTSSSSGGLGTGATAGIAVGAVAVAAVVALLAFFLYRQQRKNKALKSQIDAASSTPKYSEAPTYDETGSWTQRHEAGAWTQRQEAEAWSQRHELEQKQNASEIGTSDIYYQRR